MELAPPQSNHWERRFHRHQSRLLAALPGADVQHIGSTAIPGIWAKDGVDVLVGVPAEDLKASAMRLVAEGYVLEGSRESHAWLCWPAPSQREAAIHVMEQRGKAWRERLFFRDFLRQHPTEAQKYEALKLKMAARTDDWGEYTHQKANFVNHILNEF